MNFEVEISWPLGKDWIENENKITAIVEKYRGRRDDSGVICGMRYMCFIFTDIVDCKMALAAIRLFNITRLKIHEY